MGTDVLGGIHGGKLGARGPAAWEPPEVVADPDDDTLLMPFPEWFEAQLLKGKSLRTIAAILRTSPPVIVRLRHKNKHFDDIRNAVIKKWPQMLREKAMETALEGNVTMLIYLNKTIGGLGDGAQPIDEGDEKPKPVPAMTKSQALKLIENIREKNNVPSEP